MKNILSYTSPILGQDILNWFDYQANHETSHKKEYSFMIKRWFNIKSDRMYQIYFWYPKSDKYFNKKETMPFIRRYNNVLEGWQS